MLIREISPNITVVCMIDLIRPDIIWNALRNKGRSERFLCILQLYRFKEAGSLWPLSSTLWFSLIVSPMKSWMETLPLFFSSVQQGASKVMFSYCRCPPSTAWSDHMPAEARWLCYFALLFLRADIIAMLHLVVWHLEVTEFWWERFNGAQQS